MFKFLKDVFPTSNMLREENEDVIDTMGVSQSDRRKLLNQMSENHMLGQISGLYRAMGALFVGMGIRALYEAFASRK